ncbi:MAG: outer membrane protein transport protein [Myxococcales bacterium]|nr:outer membrane protein transport protein [Myxococcales bacterium]
MKARLLFAAALLCATVCQHRAAIAAGFAVPEHGTRKNAMGAVIGRPDDLSAIYHNPAGLILTRGTNLYINAGVLLPTTDINLRPWPGSDRYINEPVTAEGYYPQIQPKRAFGVVPMLVGSTDFGRDDIVVALGAFAGNAAGGAFADDSLARYHLLDSYIVGLYVTGAVAWRPHRYISIGAALSAVYLRIRAKRDLFPVLNGIDLGGLLGGQSKLYLAGEDVKPRFSFGLLFTPHKRLSIGVAMLTRVDIKLEGDVRVTSGADAPRKFTFEGRQKTALLFPWSLHLGANVDVFSWLELGLELRYWFYSQFVEQRTEVTGISLLDELLTPKNYHDSIQASGGVRISPPFVPGLEVMLGMHYDRTPAPDNTLSIEQPTFNHWGFHSGLRYRINSRFRVSVTYAHYIYVERTTDKTLLKNPPSNYRASGEGNWVTAVFEARFEPFQRSSKRR